MNIETINQHLSPFIEAINHQRHIQAVKMSMVKLIPFMICASVFLLIQHSCSLFPDAPLALCFVIAVQALMVFEIAASLAGTPTSSNFGAGAVAVFSCFLLSGGTLLIDPLQAYAAWIFIALLVGECFHQCSALTWKWKGIPDAVCDYLNQLTPYLCSLLVGVFFALSAPYWMIFVHTAFLWLTGCVDSLLVVMVLIALICICWVLGLHGAALISTFARPFWFYMVLANGYAFIMHQPIPYVSGEGFFQWFIWIGGSGATLGLVLDAWLFAKTNHFKQLAKNTLRGAWCNINEMVIFGTPIVQNKKMMMPFLLTPLVMCLFNYTLIAQGVIQAPVFLMPWVLPTPIGALLACGLDVMVLLAQFSSILFGMILYLPFMKSYEKELLEKGE